MDARAGAANPTRAARGRQAACPAEGVFRALQNRGSRKSLNGQRGTRVTAQLWLNVTLGIMAHAVHVLACDYDGTIAHHGRVDDETIAALGRLRDTGRRLILVTGRELQDLLAVCPHVELFDRVVAENGAVVYCPATREEKLLGEPPPEPFVRALRERGVSPLAVGRVIVATWKPRETTVLEVIRDLGLELHVTFNKDAVMVLPAGLSKATGLAEALRELGLSAHNVVGIGDAENDHAFLRLCECRIAVANAVPMLKNGADLVTRRDEGAGVRELIEN